jgi:hypothetical protein
MTEQECEEFFEQVMIAFPGVGQWLRDNSPDPAATLQVWGQSLEIVTSEEALSVLRRWSNGTLPAPIGYQRELFAVHLRQTVLADRNKRFREESQFEKQQSFKRTGPSDAFKSIAKPFTAILSLRARVMAGEMDAEDCDRAIHQIVEGAFQ